MRLQARIDVYKRQEIHKTALGAEETVDWEYFKDTPEAVDKLRQEGYTVCAVEQAEGSVMLDNLQLDKTKKYAIVMGNEVKGVQQTVVDNCDICCLLYTSRCV